MRTLRGSLRIAYLCRFARFVDSYMPFGSTNGCGVDGHERHRMESDVCMNTVKPAARVGCFHDSAVTVWQALSKDGRCGFIFALSMVVLNESARIPQGLSEIVYSWIVLCVRFGASCYIAVVNGVFGDDQRCSDTINARRLTPSDRGRGLRVAKPARSWLGMFTPGNPRSGF